MAEVKLSRGISIQGVPVSPDTTRKERLDILKMFFVEVLFEGTEGSDFDIHVLDTIEMIKDFYKGE